MARTLVILMALLGAALLPLAPLAAGIGGGAPHDDDGGDDATRVWTHEGVLVGGAMGLHVAKAGPWKQAFPMRVEPGVVGLSVSATGHDEVAGGDWWLALRDPLGEVVARSPGGTDGEKGLTVGWPTLEGSGFGEYALVIECGLCGALEYRLRVEARLAERGANLTVDAARLLVVPGKATGAGVTLVNSGRNVLAAAVSLEGLPDGWTARVDEAPALAPGASWAGEAWLTPPEGVAVGTRVAFAAVARDAAGAELDRVAMHAAYSHDIAALEARSNVVVALTEFGGSGINPYHVEFRGPASSDEHPAWHVGGYPEDALPLPLTLDAASYDDALAADADVWASVRGNTLYYVPGTRIIGFVCFGACTALDEGGHGTGTASLAGGTTTGEDPDALLVSVTGDFFYGARWAARQPWIDVVSMSLGAWLGTPTVGVSEPVGAGTGNPYVPFSIPQAQKMAYESGKRYFTGSSQGWGAWVVAGGEGASASGPCPYTFGSSFAGSPWTFAVETYWPWTELPWKTSCTPDVVAQGWDLVAASPRSLEGHNGFGHASGATPQAAGAYARVIHEARRILGSSQEGATPLPGALLPGDGVLAVAGEGAALPASGVLADGVLTVRDAEAMFLHGLEQVHTATSFARHGADARWSRDASYVAPGAEFATEGWGLLTPAARERIAAIVAGDVPLPARPDDEAAYAAAFAARLAFWEPHVAAEVWVF